MELLPYLGEQDLYDQFHHDEPWDSEHNQPLLEKMPEAFFDPRVGDLHGKTVFLAPIGEETMYFADEGTTPEQISDGLDNTISIVEADAGHAVPWTKPEDFPVDKSQPAAGLARGRGGVLTLGEACGMARSLPGGFDTALLWSLFTRAGGETIDWPSGTGEIGRGVMPGIDANVSAAGGQVGQPADVVTRFKSSKKPLPHSMEQQVAETLQQIALALVNEMDRHGQFPPTAICDKSGKPLLSWRVKMLRGLNEEALYDQFHLDEPWDSPHNLPLLQKMPDIYLNPRVGRLDGKTVFLLPTGKETIFFDDQAATEKEMTFVDQRIKEITDGVDKRVMVVVADAEHAVPWTKPEDLPIDRASPASGLERWPRHFYMMALADTQIVLLPDYIQPTRLWDFFTRAGGQELSDGPVDTKRTGLATGPEKDDSVDHAGGKVGQPAEVVTEFKSPRKPSPPSVDEQVAEKLHRIASSLEKESWSSPANGRFPPAAICDQGGKPLLSWRVDMLRYLDEKDLYDQFHLDEPWDSPHNLPLVQKMPDIYLNPQVGRLEGKTVFLLPTGKETMFFDDQGTRPSEITDGRGKTIMVVVADAEHAVPWTRPDDLPVDKASPARGLERWPNHFFMVTLANAQIALLPDNIEPTTLWGFFTRAGGERLGVPPPAPGEAAR